MLQAPFPVNAARAGDLRAVTAWRQRCATTEANPVDARFPFDEWRPLQLACAEGDAAAVETILAAGAAVDAADLSRIAPCSTGLQVAARYGHAEVCAALVRAGVCRDWRSAFEKCRRARPCVRLNKRMRAALDAWAEEYPSPVS